MFQIATRTRRAGRRLGAFFRDHPVDFLPGRKGWRGYTRGDLAADLRSGINVALLALPQGMAFALLAGADLAAGVACAAVAAMAAGLFCSSRHVALGPTNATAFTVFSFFAAYPALAARQAELMPLLAVMMALLLLVGALVRVAEAVQYVSRSVMVGYITGAAILIIANQLPGVLGVDLADAEGMRPSGFPATLVRLAEKLPDVHWPSVVVGVLTLGILVGVARWKPSWPSFALALSGGSLAALLLAKAHPAFGGLAYLEAFRWQDLQPEIPRWHPGILDDVGRLMGLAFALAFIAALETSVMVKGLAGRGGSAVNLDQDFYGVGMANAASCLVGGMPASSSLTRSALAFDTGGRSRMGLLINGLVCAGLAVALGSAVAHVPRAVLAALVIAVAWKLFKPRQVHICLATTGSDAATMLGTLAATLVVPLYQAIFAGVVLSIILYLRKAARPELVEYEFTEAGDLREADKRPMPAISIVHVEGDLFFGAADLFRTQVQRSMRDPNLRVIILRLRNARNLDATSVMALESLLAAVREEDRHLVISGVTKSVYRVLKNSGLLEAVGRENLFIHSPGNPNVSTRNALRRAQELLGTDEAEIQIFVKKEG